MRQQPTFEDQCALVQAHLEAGSILSEIVRDFCQEFEGSSDECFKHFRYVLIELTNKGDKKASQMLSLLPKS